MNKLRFGKLKKIPENRKYGEAALLQYISISLSLITTPQGGTTNSVRTSLFIS